MVRTNPWIFAAVAGTIAIQLAIIYVPFLQTIFDTQTLSASQLAIVLSASTAAFTAVEVDKWIPASTRAHLTRPGPPNGESSSDAPVASRVCPAAIRVGWWGVATERTQRTAVGRWVCGAHERSPTPERGNPI